MVTYGTVQPMNVYGRRTDKTPVMIFINGRRVNVYPAV